MPGLFNQMYVSFVKQYVGYKHSRNFDIYEIMTKTMMIVRYLYYGDWQNWPFKPSEEWKLYWSCVWSCIFSNSNYCLF